MIATLLVFLAVSLFCTGLYILLVTASKRREGAFEKVTIPPAFYKSTTIDAKTLVETQPMMVGLSKTIEESEADRAAKKIAEGIEYDLYSVWDPLPTPPPPKKKRKTRAKKKPTRVRRPKKG